MGLLLSADRKCHEALSVSWDGSLAESPAWQDAAWQRLCWSVIASDPARRSAVWQRGIRQLPSNGALPSGRILAAADQLIACLGKSEADVPSPDQVLGDLLRLSRDYEVRGGLVRRIEQRQLQAGIESLSSDLKKMARRGLGLADEGKTAEAVASYTALLGRDDLPAGEGAAAILRAELLGLLLKQEPVDLESAGKQLQALVPAGGSMPARVWNLACRLLLNRVLQTPRAGRQAVWSEGVKLLSGGTNHISADTFSGLDSLLASLQAESDSMAHRILADLMLLSPDLASMVRLQQRRVAVFASESNWQEAKTAAVLCAAMANATTGGPVGCVSRCADIMRFAGAPVAELEGFRAIWAGKNPKAGSTATLMIDSVLTDGAKAALEAAAEEPPPRRLAYLHLFAGQAREALRHAHVALTQAKDEHEILDRLDDIQTILSAIGCGLGDSDSFSRWLVSASVKGASPTTEPDKRSGSPLSYLAEFELGSGGAEGSIEPRQADGAGRAYPQMSRSERAGMAGKHLTRRRKRLVRWGAGALRDKEEAWARNCLAVAINMPQGPDDATLAIDAAVASAVCKEGVKDVGKFLETVLPLVHSVAARRHLLYRLAVAYYNQGLYEESIKCLDSSATLAEGLAESQHMAAGILRARLLIELARYEDAAGVLAGMQGWQGAPEQRARVLFLTGWTCLQTGDNADALSAFQQVVDRFGKTGVAEEAARMAGALKKGT